MTQLSVAEDKNHRSGKRCVDATRNGRRSRRKGHNWERDLVRLFREAMPGADIHRGMQARSGREVPDVDVPCFWVEAKRGKQTNIKGALKQAASDATGGRWAVAICKDDRKPASATMSLEDFLELVEAWWVATNR